VKRIGGGVRARMAVATAAVVVAGSVGLVVPDAGALATQAPLRDYGRIQQSSPYLPPLHRDAGMNASLSDGRTLWLFGDTINAPGGLRSSSSAVGNQGSVVVDDLNDPTGSPVQTIPYTADEVAFNAQPGNVAVGRRIALWPAGVATQDGSHLLVFYGQVTVHDDWGQWVPGPTGVGTLHYTPGGKRVVTRVNDSLFSAAEGFRGGFFAAPDGFVYGYDCSLFDGCRVARAPYASASARSAWRFWDGAGWNANISSAARMAMPDPEAQLTGFPERYPNSGNASVGYSPRLGRYVMTFMAWPGLGDAAQVRYADSPVGPWTTPAQHALPGCESFNCYWPIFHEGFSTSSRVGLSYFRPDEPNPGGLSGAVRVLQLSSTRAFVDPFGSIDSAALSGGRTARVQGWALDPDVVDSLDVHVYVDGQWGGAYTADVSRPDVGATFTGYGSAHAFDITLAGLSPGNRQVCVYGINQGAGGNSLIGCRTVAVPSGSPIGNVDTATQLGPRGARLQGWALDPDTTGATELHVYVDGRWGGAFTAADQRPDIALAYPGYGAGHGFDLELGGLAPGTRQICVYGINTGAGSNSLIACRSVLIRSGSPFGNIDSHGGISMTTARVNGWAIDPDTAGPVELHAYVDSRWGGAFTASAPRHDVGAAYPGYGNDHGFQIDVNGLVKGANRVCVYGINQGPGANSLIGCVTEYR
jgi:hypothetical protein